VLRHVAEGFAHDERDGCLARGREPLVREVNRHHGGAQRDTTGGDEIVAMTTGFR
jgi:hypothetical protein